MKRIANDILSKGTVLDGRTLPKVRMPNRDGFVPDIGAGILSSPRQIKP
jgi:hypothetical protein